MEQIVRYLREEMFGKPNYSDDSLADVYICTFAGGRGGTLFRMSAGDAKVLCSQPKTQGVGAYGGEWMLMWSTHNLIPNDSKDWIKDDGRFDKLIEQLGLKKIGRERLTTAASEVKGPSESGQIELPLAP